MTRSSSQAHPPNNNTSMVVDLPRYHTKKLCTPSVPDTLTTAKGGIDFQTVCARLQLKNAFLVVGFFLTRGKSWRNPGSCLRTRYQHVPQHKYAERTKKICSSLHVVRNTFGETTMKHVIKSVKTVQRSAYASESTPCCYCCLCFCNGCCRGLAGVLSMSRWTLVSPMRNILLRYLQTIHHTAKISTVVNIRLHDVVTNVHAQRASRQPQKVSLRRASPAP